MIGSVFRIQVSEVFSYYLLAKRIIRTILERVHWEILNTIPFDVALCMCPSKLITLYYGKMNVVLRC